MFGGLDICSLEAVVAKDGQEVTSETLMINNGVHGDQGDEGGHNDSFRWSLRWTTVRSTWWGRARRRTGGRSQRWSWRWRWGSHWWPWWPWWPWWSWWSWWSSWSWFWSSWRRWRLAACQPIRTGTSVILRRARRGRVPAKRGRRGKTCRDQSNVDLGLAATKVGLNRCSHIHYKNNYSRRRVSCCLYLITFHADSYDSTGLLHFPKIRQICHMPKYRPVSQLRMFIFAAFSRAYF